MWGQVDEYFSIVFNTGIIPTHVGTSLWCNPCTSRLQDHPHACGDKGLAELAELAEEGSSPRVWGQVIRLFENPAELRIIPTRVGTSKADIKNI